MRWFAIVGVIAVGVIALYGCQRESSEPVASESVASSANDTRVAAINGTDDIQWMQGDIQGEIDAAFSRAQREGKSVFLYWGAAWCPPCFELKAYVFSRKDFKQKLKQFVPVYLDGDSQGAQQLAEVFNVTGYPTVLILRASDRHELARIAGGMDMGRYADVLDLANESSNPIASVLEQVSSNKAVTSPHCQRLGFNAWSLDQSTFKQSAQFASALQQAAENCRTHSEVAHDRLYLASIGFMNVSEVGRLELGQPLDTQFDSLMQKVASIVRQPKRAVQSVDLLIEMDEEFFSLLGRTTFASKSTLLNDYKKFVLGIAQNTTIAAPLRLRAMSTQLLLDQAEKAQSKIQEKTDSPIQVQRFSPELVRQANQLAEELLANAKNADERPSVVNAALWVYQNLQDYQSMRTLLEHEIQSAKHPFYYLSDLADLDEESGDHQAALKKLSHAYELSQGPATRFQWGVAYVSGMIRMVPADSKAIEAATVDVLNELKVPNSLYQRNRSRLDRLANELHDWSADQPTRLASLSRIRAHWQTICKQPKPNTLTAVNANCGLL
jgi:thioredoxin-related protein